MLAHPVRARLEPEGQLQIVEVAVRGAYRPDAIVARAGVPLRIRFRRDDEDSCSERVVFSAPRIDRRLAPSGVTFVDLPAQPAGEIRFTCGMGRYRGRIELIDGARRSPLARYRDQVAAFDAPLGIAIAVGLGSLPVTAFLALAFLDGVAAVAIAALALVGWVAGCLWAFRASPSSS